MRHEEIVKEKKRGEKGEVFSRLVWNAIDESARSREILCVIEFDQMNLNLLLGYGHN